MMCTLEEYIADAKSQLTCNAPNGEYISGRFYTGIFGGSFYKSDGIYFKVDNRMIKMDVNTKITFSE